MARVLIVDDEPDYREFLQIMLSREGHSVATARGAAEALAVNEDFQPDIVIVDWMLRNRLHGLDVVALLRRSGSVFKPILITGYPSAELRNRIAESDVFEFLEKPFSANELRDAVRRACSR